MAPYATYGTSELARNVAESIGHYNAVLMENHGLLAVGSSIPQAFGTAEEIELVAEIYYRTKCIGNPVILSDEEMEKIVLKFKGYGRQ